MTHSPSVPNARPARAVFADERHRVGHNSAQSDTGQETDDQQLTRRVRARCEQSGESKVQRQADQNGPPANLVGDHAEQQRPDQNTERCRPEHVA